MLFMKLVWFFFFLCSVDDLRLKRIMCRWRPPSLLNITLSCTIDITHSSEWTLNDDQWAKINRMHKSKPVKRKWRQQFSTGSLNFLFMKMCISKIVARHSSLVMSVESRSCKHQLKHITAAYMGVIFSSVLSLVFIYMLIVPLRFLQEINIISLFANWHYA